MNSTKAVIPSRAYHISQYKNLRRKILKFCVDIYFNKQCLQQNFTPNYIKIKISHTSPAAKFTKEKIIKLRIKDEIKFLYIKKEKLNYQLYQTHLKLVKEWGKCRYPIQESTIDSLNFQLVSKYKTLDKKLTDLAQKQRHDDVGEHSTAFHPRIVNQTNITFTHEQLSLLNKGLKYNLGFKQKGWIKKLALETETTINKLPVTEQDYMRYKVTENINKLYNKYNTKAVIITYKTEKKGN